MLEFWIIITILCLLIIAGGTLLTIRRFYRSFDNSRQESEAWQQAQEGRQRIWEVRQGKHILDAEKKLADQLKDARREWRDWNLQIRQDHQEWRDDVDLEKALTHLLHIEQMEIAPQAAGERIPPKDWRPPTFYKADLRGRDLSYRYMVRTDLREVQLMEANLYMTDLTGAGLAGADLQQANLIGANLSGADLRGTNLSGANLMVADLHNTVLHGANLRGARNLTAEQLQTAIYDSTTLIDSNIDITLPRIRSVLTTTPQLLSSTSAGELHNDEMPTTPDEQANHANIAHAEQPTESETPLTEPGTAGDEHAVLPVEANANVSTELTAPQANGDPTPTTEQNTALPMLAEEDEEALPESPMPANETNKKRGTNRKRSNKAKQAATTAIQPFTSIREEASTNEVNTSRELAVTQEVEESEEEERLPHKIIQWPTRAPKTSPLPNSSEQNNTERAQKNRGNNLNETPDTPKNQRIQAN